MHRLDAPPSVSIPCPSLQRRKAAAARPYAVRVLRLRIVDGEELDEAQRGPIPCPGDESRKFTPRRVSGERQIEHVWRISGGFAG